MKLLVLSYNTLPGAGKALVEEAEENKMTVETLELRWAMSMSARSLSLYSRFVQKAKELLGSLYKAYDPLDYTFITALTDYINDSGFDAVISTDAYSVKVMSLSKQAGLSPLSYALISDYEAASIHTATMLDGYFIAQDEIKYYMIKHGICKDRLYSYGMPVPSGFKRNLGRWAARNYLVIPQNLRVYLLLAGGMSYEEVRDICAGMLEKESTDFLLYVLLQRDSELKEPLEKKFRGKGCIRIITITKKINIYMEGADVVLTQPLAYESYEAAVAGAPLVHIMTGKGSERRLAEYFAAQDMSLKAKSVSDTVSQARRLASEKALAQRMKLRQSQFANCNASSKILDTIFNIQQKKADTYK